VSEPHREFIAVLDAVRGALDGGRRRVITILLDAFGWRFVQRHGDHPLLRRLAADGTVEPLRSQFPATTTAHVTTMHFGVPVGAHGAYEWRVWEPALRRVVTPLLFSYAGDRERDTLAGAGIAMADLLPTSPTLYEQLAAQGIASLVFHPAAFSPSTYDHVATRGATLRPWAGLRAGLADLAARVAAHDRCHAYLYLDAIDATGHRQGPSSPAFDAVVIDTLDALNDAFFGPDAARLDDTLLVLTADHGQVDVSPDRVDDLDLLWPGLTGALETDGRGAPVAPAGSARDVFLHIAADRVDDAVATLGAALDGRGSVHRTADLVAAGAFGDAGPRLRARLGSVCVLPAAGRMAWLRGHADVERVFLGHHGGRHPDEAATFLATIELG
jgi:hypothetical protein